MKYLLGMLSFTRGKSCVMTVFSREKCFIRDGPVDKDIVHGLYIYLSVRVHRTNSSYHTRSIKKLQVSLLSSLTKADILLTRVMYCCARLNAHKYINFIYHGKKKMDKAKPRRYGDVSFGARHFYKFSGLRREMVFRNL